MIHETVCGHCPLANGCRYRSAGVSAAEIAYWAIYRRDAAELMRRYPWLGVEDIRAGAERYAACPGHGAAPPPQPGQRPVPAVA